MVFYVIKILRLDWYWLNSVKLCTKISVWIFKSCFAHLGMYLKTEILVSILIEAKYCLSFFTLFISLFIMNQSLFIAYTCFIACIIFYIVPFHKNILLLLACFTNTSSIKIKFNDKTKTNIKHIVWVQYAHHTILRSITIYCSYYNTTLC